MRFCCSLCSFALNWDQVFDNWICLLYSSIVGTNPALNGPGDATCFYASCIRILSGLECSLNTFLKRCKCFTENLKQNKNKDLVTQRASDILSREDTVSRQWNENSSVALIWKLRLEPLNYFFPLPKEP